MRTDVLERNKKIAIVTPAVAVTIATTSLHDTSIANIQSEIEEIAVGQNLWMMNLANEAAANDMSLVPVEIRRANVIKVEKAAMNASDGEQCKDRMVENNHVSY